VDEGEGFKESPLLSRATQVSSQPQNTNFFAALQIKPF